MKLHYSFFTLLIVATISSNIVQAQQHPVLHDDAVVTMHRTKAVIEGAQAAVAKGKVYTSDLSKSIAHQHRARQLYSRGSFERSIYQSLRARRLAIAAIKANHGGLVAAWQLTPTEHNYEQSSPPDDELDKEIQQNQVDVGLQDQKAVTTRYIDLEVH